ncbi:GNAT family N-acetyltransferase [Aeromicrobium massiliense]|uniref:GNAT family N-acetyltransferase n=1 Tax=Aeromicrobium massiliense TaxID=1464554 RepID=UPI000AC67F0A|nr:GNAT family N-acetyltransferase [Aeromicrobium massiliense]
MQTEWAFRPSRPEDASWMVELRAVVLKPDLARLGRFDPARVRQRFLAGFVPEHTRVIVVDGQDVGLVTVRPEPDARWIEHFYLHPAHQGRGIGRSVLTDLLGSGGDDDRPFRLNVLQGSAARRLYERHGFVLEHEDPVDVFMRADPPVR